MDSTALLALCTKAKLVFEGMGSFLSFPTLSPEDFDAGSLDFTGPSPDVTTLSDFSRLSNMIPNGSFFPPSDPAYLWDAYSDVLSTAILAQGSSTPGQAEASDRAEALLYVRNPDGSVKYSATYRDYLAYRDAYDRAELAYKFTQAEEQSSPDPAVRQRWTSEDEPMLRAVVDQAEADWDSAGSRAAVESALEAIRSYAALAPSINWRKWSDDFIPDLDLLTDPNNNTFAPTGFAPSDATVQGEWPKLQLSAAEISLLVAQAPADLKAALGDGSGDSNLSLLSFEYRYVTLTRPWFHPEAFAARFWKLPPGTPDLSDGGTPPLGSCPAYVTAVVLVRNVSEQTIPPASVSPSAPAHPTGSGSVWPWPNRHRPLPDEHLEAVPVGTPTHDHPEAVEVQPPALASVPELTLQNPAFADGRGTIEPAGRVSGATGGSHLSALSVQGMTRLSFLLNQIGGQNFSSTISHAPHEGFNSPTTTSTPDGKVSILAYICRSVPKCPNPDPSFSWA